MRARAHPRGLHKRPVRRCGRDDDIALAHSRRKVRCGLYGDARRVHAKLLLQRARQRRRFCARIFRAFGVVQQHAPHRGHRTQHGSHLVNALVPRAHYKQHLAVFPRKAFRTQRRCGACAQAREGAALQHGQRLARLVAEQGYQRRKRRLSALDIPLKKAYQL